MRNHDQQTRRLETHRGHSSFSIHHSSFRPAFTLIELMVVIGIISLLIAIVLPSVGAARDQARVATTRALISVLETGVEQFRADHTVGGEYPPSLHFEPLSPDSGEPLSPHREMAGQPDLFVGGMNLVAWALVGADMLGTPGFRDLNNDNNGYWYGDVAYEEIESGKGQQASSLYAIDLTTNRPAISRSAPYVDQSRMKFPVLRQVASDEWHFFIESKPQAGYLNSICFLDSFDQPILYYRANPGETRIAMDWPGVEYASQVKPEDRGIYNYADNRLVTGARDHEPFDLGAGRDHPMGYVDSFANHLQNPNVTAVPRHRPDSFILLSAGVDALYGTADDVANFPINK